MMAAIIVPVRNGEKNVLPLTEALAGLRLPVTLVFVDDGSRDDSWRLIREACSHPPDPLVIRGIRLDRNRGQQSALLAGMAAGLHEGAAITMDDDLSHPVSLLPGLLKALENGAELAYADPPARPGAPLRRLASRLHQVHLALLTGNSPAIRVGSYRAMDAALVRRILDSPFRRPYISAMALRLRPRPRWTMVPSPEWPKGTSGRFSPGRLLLLEFQLALIYGPWAGNGRIHSRHSRASSADTAGKTAAGWIAETAGPKEDGE